MVVFLVAAASVSAQTNTWLLVGSSINTAWSSGRHSAVLSEGIAVTLPLTQRVFIRPGVVVSEVDPLYDAKGFPMLQPACMLGLRATKRFAVLSGFAETIQIPRSGAVYLPTLQISTATRIKSHWGIFTPISFNQKGYGLSLQLGYRF